MAQALLEAGKNGLLVATLKVDDAIRRQARLREGRGEKIGVLQAPEHPPMRAGGNAGDEECRRRAIDHAVSAAGHLMQGTAGEAAVRKMRIERRQAERQGRGRAPRLAFDLPDPSTQGCE